MSTPQDSSSATTAAACSETSVYKPLAEAFFGENIEWPNSEITLEHEHWQSVESQLWSMMALDDNGCREWKTKSHVVNSKRKPLAALITKVQEASLVQRLQWLSAISLSKEQAYVEDFEDPFMAISAAFSDTNPSSSQIWGILSKAVPDFGNPVYYLTSLKGDWKSRLVSAQALSGYCLVKSDC